MLHSTKSAGRSPCKHDVMLAPNGVRKVVIPFSKGVL
jgi:hypothetical protein